MQILPAGTWNDSASTAVCADAFEECADFPGPLPQVRPQKLRLLGIRKLDHLDRFVSRAQPELACAADADVADPFRHPARGDQVAHAVDGEQVDRGPPPLAALAPLDFEHPRAGDAEAEPGQQGDEPVEDVLREPAGLLKAFLHCVDVGTEI